MSWATFPLEIRVMIMREVIGDLPKRYDDDIMRRLRELDEHLGKGDDFWIKFMPKVSTPCLLQSFRDLVIVCRDFHNILTHHLIFDGRPLSLQLQIHQLRGVHSANSPQTQEY
jgi:hypothetical protein